MAIYHLSVKPISRAGGRSATAAAAYRSGELVQDHTSGEAFDYTRKRGVEHAEIVLSSEAARQDINWARDREALWNAAERAENRSNSRVAREYELALPHELNKGQRVELVRAFAKDIADRYQVAVDFAIHEPHRNGDERNHHAHVLTTTRVVEPGGLGAKSEIEWSDANRRKADLVPAKEEIGVVRERWAELTNEHLQAQGLEARVDHRSLEAQGIDREPTSHLGPAVSGMERRGIDTEVRKRLEREAQAVAQERLEQAAEIGRIERERAQIQRSILDLSGDLAQAKRERDRGQEKGTQTAPQLDQIRTEAAERWKAFREQEKAREGAEQTPKSSAAELSPPASLDEKRRQAAERWAEYRRQSVEHPERQPAKGPEQSRDQGQDGPEID